MENNWNEIKNDNTHEHEIILEMSNIHKRFPGVYALKNLNFQLRKGEVHILLGENGAGKSTLIKIMTGAYVPDEGKIFVNNKEIVIKNPIHAQDLGISAVYQEFNLIPYLDVGENIFLSRTPTYGKYISVLNKRKIYKESEELLKQVGAKIDPRMLVRDLGVASQQMVEIAKALASKAKILIMDEPSAVLTEEEIEKLFTIIKLLSEQGVGIVYISHRLEEFLKIGDRVTVLRDGEYVETVDIRDKNNIDMDKLIQLMVGRKLEDKFPKVKTELGSEILRVSNLNRKGVLNDINFSLKKGEILGIAGLVGAGRTEVARAIFGADKIDSGEIFLLGNKVDIKSPRDAIALNIGLVPEDRKRDGLVQPMSVEENIIISSSKQFSKFGFFNMKKRKKITSELVKSLRIATPSLEQKVVHLSGGNQQKVVLARWIASKSKFIIFDEPTRGIDVGAKVEVYQLMNELIKQGVGVIMISSELPELLGMSDRILVMHEGKITGELNREDATQEKILWYASGGVVNECRK